MITYHWEINCKLPSRQKRIKILVQKGEDELWVEGGPKEKKKLEFGAPYWYLLYFKAPQIPPKTPFILIFNEEQAH